MQWLKQLFARVFSKKSPDWNALDYGKPSTSGDDARKNNDV